MSATTSLQGRYDAVAIGASAGGIEALSLLLPALPADSPAAIFVVIHLPRERPSLLTELFRSKCAAVVTEAEDKELVMPGTIYFAAPDYHLLIDEGPRLALSVDALVQYSRPSIDVLFESAAEIYRRRLLAVLLTGGNDDGAAGLQAVRECGGMTVVQDPASAQASFMPAAALRRGPVDEVLTLERIAGLLRSLEPAT